MIEFVWMNILAPLKIPLDTQYIAPEKPRIVAEYFKSLFSEHPHETHICCKYIIHMIRSEATIRVVTSAIFCAVRFNLSPLSIQYHILFCLC
jgi:hypothetical protein